MPLQNTKDKLQKEKNMQHMFMQKAVKIETTRNIMIQMMNIKMSIMIQWSMEMN